jgi:hypothetical protein
MDMGMAAWRRRRSWAILAGMLIAGCQSSPPEVVRPVPEPPPPEQAQPAPVAPEPPVAQVPVPAKKPAPPASAEQLRAVGANEAERPLSSRSVIGLEFAEVLRLLGEPALRLEEPPTQVWQYQVPECTLRLVFFPEVKTQQYRSLAVQLWNSDEESDDAKSRCLNAIRTVAHSS